MNVLVRANNYGPAWALVAVIYKARYEAPKGHKQDPVKLTSARLAEFRISRGQKLRALKILGQSGLFRVEHLEKRNPLVTILDLTFPTS